MELHFAHAYPEAEICSDRMNTEPFMAFTISPAGFLLPDP